MNGARKRRQLSFRAKPPGLTSRMRNRYLLFNYRKLQRASAF
jgi:hypothetical protein